MYGAGDPLSAIPFAEKVRLCAEINAAARARDPRVEQVSVSLAASWSVIDIVRGDGFVASDVRPLVRLNSIVAKQGGPAGDRHLAGLSLFVRACLSDNWSRSTTCLARRW